MDVFKWIKNFNKASITLLAFHLTIIKFNGFSVKRYPKNYRVCPPCWSLSSTENHIKELRSDWNGDLESIEVSNLIGENCENLKSLIATQIIRAQ